MLPELLFNIYFSEPVVGMESFFFFVDTCDDEKRFENFSRFPRMLKDLREMCVEERAVIILLDVGNDEFEELDFENGHESLSVMMFETFRRQFW